MMMHAYRANVAKKEILDGGEAAHFIGATFTGLHNLVKRQLIQPINRRERELRHMTFRRSDLIEYLAESVPVLTKVVLPEMEEPKQAPPQEVQPTEQPTQETVQETQMSTPEVTQEPITQDVTQEQPKEPVMETFTSENARRFANMETGTFYGHVERGNIPYKVVDGHKVFRKVDLEAFIELRNERRTKLAQKASLADAKPSTAKKAKAKAKKRYPNLEKAWAARRAAAAAKRKNEAGVLATPKVARESAKFKVIIAERCKLSADAMKLIGKIYPVGSVLTSPDRHKLEVLEAISDSKKEFEALIAAVASGKTVMVMEDTDA